MSKSIVSLLFLAIVLDSTIDRGVVAAPGPPECDVLISEAERNRKRLHSFVLTWTHFTESYENGQALQALEAKYRMAFDSRRDLTSFEHRRELLEAPGAEPLTAKGRKVRTPDLLFTYDPDTNHAIGIEGRDQGRLHLWEDYTASIRWKTGGGEMPLYHKGVWPRPESDLIWSARRSGDGQDRKIIILMRFPKRLVECTETYSVSQGGLLESRVWRRSSGEKMQECQMTLYEPLDDLWYPSSVTQVVYKEGQRVVFHKGELVISAFLMSRPFQEENLNPQLHQSGS